MAARLLGSVEVVHRDDQADLKALKEGLKNTIAKTSLEASALRSRRSALHRAHSAVNERTTNRTATNRIPDENVKSGRSMLDTLFRGRAEEDIEFKASGVQIFVSSTFSDFQIERDAIARATYGTIKEMCKSVSVDLQLQDLRTDISDWAFNEHMFADITKYILQKCRRNNRYVVFVLLLGDRYGYRPLPLEISSETFNILLALAKKINPESARLLSDWYLEDRNAVPSIYILQEHARLKDLSTAESFVNMSEKFSEIENALRSLLLTASSLAVDLSKLPPNIEHKLDIGIVQREAELCLRLLRKRVMISDDTPITLFREADIRVVAYLRDLQFFTEHNSDTKACIDHSLMNCNYIDWQRGVDSTGVPCKKLHTSLYSKQKLVKTGVINRLKHEQRAKIVRGTITATDFDDKFRGEISTLASQVTAAVVDTVSSMLLSASVQSTRSSAGTSTMYFGSELSMESACASVILKDWLVEELLFHAKFCEYLHDSAQNYARTQTVEQANQVTRQYLRVQKEKAPLVVVAPSSCGISTLIASVIRTEVADACLSDAGYACLYRFVGKTHLSSTVYSLLYTVALQLCYVYNVAVDKSFLGNSQTLLNYIQVLISDQCNAYGKVQKSTQSRKLSRNPVVTVIFDGLEALRNDPELGLLLNWLPEQLPLNINWIISWSYLMDEVQKGVFFDWLRVEEANPSASVHHITVQQCVIGELEVKTLLDNFLRAVRSRKLTVEQQNFIIEKFAGKPLNHFYLRLVFDEALDWRSYDSLTGHISFSTDSFRDFVVAYLYSLCDKFAGTTSFVHYALGYISTAPYGISETELLDLLSANKQVMREITERERLTPLESATVQNVPPLYLARILFDIRHFLCECVSDKKFVVQWCSGEFARWSIELFFPSDGDKALHQDFVEYYRVRCSGYSPSYRVLRCLPLHCLMSGKLNVLNRLVLFNLEFLTNFMRVFGLEQLIGLVNEMLERSRALVEDIGDTMMIEGTLKDAQRAIDEMLILLQCLRFLMRCEQSHSDDFKENWAFYLLNILTDSGNYDALFENLLTGVKRFSLSEDYPSIGLLAAACRGKVKERSSGTSFESLCPAIPRVGLCGNSLRVQQTDVMLIEKPFHRGNQTIFACYRKRGQRRQILIENSYYLSTFAAIQLGTKPTSDVRQMQFRADLNHLFILNQIELSEFEILTGRSVKTVPLELSNEGAPLCFVVSNDGVWIAVGYASSIRCFLHYEPKPVIPMKNCHTTFCMLFTPQKLLVTAHEIAPAVGHEAEIVLNIWDYVAQNLYGSLEFERVSKLVGVPQSYGLMLCDGVGSSTVLFACQNGTLMIIDCLAIAVLWRYDPTLRNVVSEFSVVPRLLDLSCSQAVVHSTNAALAQVERIAPPTSLRVAAWIVECRPGETCVNVLDITRRKQLLSYMNDDLLSTHAVQFASVTVYERETDRYRQVIVLIGTKYGKLLRLTVQEYKHNYVSPISRTTSLITFTESADLMLDDPIGFDVEQRRSSSLVLCAHRALNHIDKLMVASYSKQDQSLHMFLLDDLPTRNGQPVMLARDTTIETLTSIRDESRGSSDLLENSINAHVHLVTPHDNSLDHDHDQSPPVENICDSVLLLTASRVFQSWNITPRFVRAEREFTIGEVFQVDKMELVDANVLGTSSYVLVISGTVNAVLKRKGRSGAEELAQTTKVLFCTMLEDALSSSFPRSWHQLPHIPAPSFWIRSRRHPLIYTLNVVDELHCRVSVYSVLDLQLLKRLMIRTPWNSVKQQEVVRDMRLNFNEHYLIFLYQLQLEDHRNATLKSYEACAVYLGNPTELIETGAAEIERKQEEETRGLIFCSNFAESNVNTNVSAGRVDADQRSALLLFNSIRNASRRVQLNTRFYTITDFGESEMILGTQGDLVVWELGDQQLLEQAQRITGSNDGDKAEAEQLAAEASTKSCVHQVYQDAIPCWFHHSMTEIITRNNPRAVRQNPLDQEHFNFVRQPITTVLVSGLPDRFQVAQFGGSKRRPSATLSDPSSEQTSTSPTLQNYARLPPELVLSGCADGTVIIWRWRMLKTAASLETETLHTYRTVVYRAHSEAITALCVSAAYRLVASGSSDRFICLINLDSGNVLKRVNTFVNVKSLQFYILSTSLLHVDRAKVYSSASGTSSHEMREIRLGKTLEENSISQQTPTAEYLYRPNDAAVETNASVSLCGVPILHVIGNLTPKRTYLQYFRIVPH